MTGIYTITNLINKKLYIGSSSRDIKYRFLEHKKTLRKGIHRNSYLQKSWNKYGENSFKFEILEEYPKEICIYTEQFWMNLLNTTNENYGYNLAPVAGSSLGQRRSDTQKMNISKSVKGKRVGCLNPNYGKKASEETLLKMRNSITTSKKVLMIDINSDVVIKEFISIGEAESFLNKRGTQIGKVCNNKPKHLSAYGYKWKFKNTQV